MNGRRLPAFLLAAALLCACGRPPAAPLQDEGVRAAAVQPAAASASGDYALTGGRTGRLSLRPTDGAHWRIELRGGSDPRDGAAAAADCEIVAEGRLDGGRIHAQVEPFEGELLSVDAEDLAQRPARIDIALDGDRARVDTDFPFCAPGAVLSGDYLRTASAGPATAGPESVAGTWTPLSRSLEAEGPLRIDSATLDWNDCRGRRYRAERVGAAGALLVLEAGGACRLGGQEVGAFEFARSPRSGCEAGVTLHASAETADAAPLAVGVYRREGCLD
ncbi:hypothetical protein [Coralloluteibacterium thermophilus]|uniref:Lipoprotein n=1 Tax=Coralloluteibacterium thermophilum TaxID=2707049 RepID=A0ABV9NLP7_9GAMM